MGDSAAQLRRARDLFRQGLPAQAEEIVGRLLRDDPRDATALNFRAYLLYRRGSLDDALAAYRTLAGLEPAVPGHQANIGLICYKTGRYAEAQRAFERQLELQPGDPKALRSLGFCHERRDAPREALSCFTMAGDEANAGRVRQRLPPGGEGAAAPAAGAEVGDRPAVQRVAIGAEVAGPGVSAWIARAVLPRAEDRRGPLRAGDGGLVLPLGGGVSFNPAYCAGHRGPVSFNPAARDQAKAASRFGGRFGSLGRAEGEGDLVLAGLGGGLSTLRLERERLFVNWRSFVLCGGGASLSFDQSGLVKEAFLATEVAGPGLVVLAIRDAPIVLPVEPEAPVHARPEAVVAWTESVGYEPEVVPDLKSAFGKGGALRLRFEGRGALVLQPG